ncbi:DUF2381 family protein [Pyxidicoccus trucidator]|uniref:DUF2381 family protein n=1 Tax=Pyxidicoccus trucidator TaxID=2709662 RepID=UPI0030844330
MTRPHGCIVRFRLVHASYSAVLLVFTLLVGAASTAQPRSASWMGGVRVVELPEEPTGQEPEVVISPGLSTTFTFEAELSRGESGKDRVELERREVFSLVDVGQTTLRLTPSDKLVPGARLRLSVRFKDGAAPSAAVFILVVHPVRAERLVEVYRKAQPVEFYQREARAARMETERCHEELERERAEHTVPGGLAGLIAAGTMDINGVGSQNLTESVVRARQNALVTVQVLSYRSARQVALEVVLENPEGAQTWTTTEAVLTDPKGVELKALPVWQSGPVAPGGSEQRIVVQAEALEAQAQGLYTLKLWEPSTGRTVILSGVSFP